MKVLIWTPKVFQSEVPDDSTYGHAVVFYRGQQLEGHIDTRWFYVSQRPDIGWASERPVVKPIDHPKNNRCIQCFIYEELD